MTYRFALIGCGNIAQRHARLIAGMAELVAVCDPVIEKAEQLASQYQCRSYSNIGELLASEKVDIVSICTPNGLHASHSITSLEAGCHVLCEKPMAITVADAIAMIDTAERCKRKLFVVKQNRFNPPIQMLKEMLDKNLLGRIFSFQINCFWNRPPAYYEDSWRGTLALDGGTLFTQFSHFIDLLYWCLGELDHVQGTRTNVGHKGIIEFEDSGAAILYLKSGINGTLQYNVNSYNKNMEGSFTIFGEKGTVKIGGQYLNELDFFSVEAQSAPKLPEGKPANQYGFYEGSMSNHDKVYKYLIESLNGSTQSMVEADEALKTVEIIEKIYAGSPLI